MVPQAVESVILVGCIYYLTVLLYVPEPKDDYALKEIPFRTFREFNLYRSYANVQHQLSVFDLLRFPLYIKRVYYSNQNVVFETRQTSPFYCFFCTSFWVSFLVCVLSGYANIFLIFGYAGLVNVVSSFVNFDK